MNPLVALGMEIIKMLIIERNVQQLAAKAGVSPEELEGALTKLRAEFRALDPTTLPEV